MKKTYVKPDIVFESFMTCTSIATGCENVALHAYGDCAYEFEWIDNNYMTIFDSSVKGGTACMVNAEDGEYNGICYHNPNPTSNIFTS